MSSFKAQLAEFARVVKSDVVQVRDEAGLIAWGQVSNLTPVDLGRARNSWNFNYSSADTSVPGPTQVSLSPKQTPTIRGLAVGFEPVFITSSLDYIIPLEDGHSGKGDHMVEKAVIYLKSRMSAIIGAA